LSAFALSQFLTATNMLDQALVDGMVICACMPMAINSVIVLTARAGGHEAAAVFNATFGNIIGIFLSPVLVVLYLGAPSDGISLGEVFYKLTLKVIVPLIIGQILQKFWTQAREFYVKHKRFFAKVKEFSISYIV
jgi:sodium/bile acid cotransporter 7